MSKYRPALDVVIPEGETLFADLLEAVVDDFHPFAIEADNRQARRIHFSHYSDRDSAARAINDSLGRARVTIIPVNVPDDGARWAERSQSELTAVRVGKIVIAPPWDTSSPLPQILKIVIKPSMGFGTGHHASTRLCLRALQTLQMRGVSVTDLGTGSGVLAIAAVTLGARLVVALEEDPDASASAYENLKANTVECVVKLLHADLSTSPIPSPADVVTANLTGETLRKHAARIAAFSAPDGTLILGGLTHKESEGVIDAFTSLAQPVKTLHEEGWSCLMLRTYPSRANTCPTSRDLPIDG